MISVDYTFFAQFVIFVVLFVALSKLFFKPLLDMFDRRERLVTEPARKADVLNEENEKISADYRVKLANGLSRAEEIKSAKLKEAADKEKDILADAREENEKFLASMRKDMVEARQRALKELEGDIEKHSAQIAQQILGRAIS